MGILGISSWSTTDMYGFIQAVRGMFEIIPDTPFDGDANYEDKVKMVAPQLALEWDSEDINSCAYLRTVAALWVETTTISYFDLGVPLVDGGLPLAILAEHVVIVAFYNKIVEVKARQRQRLAIGKMKWKLEDEVMR